MSYPWWLWRITWIKDNGEKVVEDWTMTGLDPHDALGDFLSDYEQRLGSTVEKQAEGWRPVTFEYVRCDTFGIDPESDKAILALQAQADEPVRNRLQVGDFGE